VLKPLLASLAAALVIAAPANASLQTDLDRLVAAGVPGAIAYSNGDGFAAGYAAPHDRMRPTDRFRAGSATKAYTAAIVLQLAGEGRLSLDDPAGDLVPGGDAISVRQLLNMSAGLADYLGDDDTVANSIGEGRVFAPAELIGLAAQHPAHFAPGSSWSYCNTCYIALGMLVERVTGHSFAAELRDRILVPARLRHTTFGRGKGIGGRHAHGYMGTQDVTDLNQSWSWTAGALVTTAPDIARFYRALLGGKLLKREQMRELKTVVELQAPFGPGTMTGYATGILRMQLPCGTAWGHDGGTPGYRTFTLNGPHRQAVVMVNRDEDELTPRQVKALNRALRTAYCTHSKSVIAARIT
jgi:D-alanyl-D-alanine carboxypeptidase